MNQVDLNTIKQFGLLAILCSWTFSALAASCNDETVGFVLAKQKNPARLSLIYDEGSTGRCRSRVSEPVTQGGAWQEIDKGDGIEIGVTNGVITSLGIVPLEDIPAYTVRAAEKAGLR